MQQQLKLEPSINVLGEPLEDCSTDPITGFLRDGCCNTCDEDTGSHTICVQLTETFLEYSKSAGNDLTTPRPEWGFPGLKAGNSWCLCASRWLQAYQENCAPHVRLKSTHKRALDIVPFAALSQLAIDLN